MLQIDAFVRPFIWTFHDRISPQGARTPYEAPRIWYGSEVFELNEKLRDKAVEFAQRAGLKSSPELMEYCNRFQGPLEAAKLPPSTIKADVASSNTFFHGKILSEAFHQSCKSFMNNAAEYGATDQESSAILTALLHGAWAKRLDFSRVILMKAGSNFDQPPEGESLEHPIHNGHGRITLALENLYLAGTEIVTGILTGWEDIFSTGVPADDYIGDIFGYLGGKYRPDENFEAEPDEAQMDEVLVDETQVDDEVIDDI